MFNYVYIVHEDYFMTVAHADIGAAKSGYITVRDQKTGVVDEIQIKDFTGMNVHIDQSKFATECKSVIFRVLVTP